MMEWVLQRYSDDGDSTLGLLFKEIVDAGKKRLHFFCDCIEDEFREIKVSGETRIGAGHYELKIRKADTPMTLRYRKKYKWFQYFIEITGIPNFKYVYVHIGNVDDDSDGCLLVGFGSSKINDTQSIQNSTLAMKAWYSQVYDHLDQGGRAWLTIKDEKELWKIAV